MPKDGLEDFVGLVAVETAIVLETDLPDGERDHLEFSPADLMPEADLLKARIESLVVLRQVVKDLLPNLDSVLPGVLTRLAVESSISSFVILITFTIICSYYLCSPIITCAMSVLFPLGGTGPPHIMFCTFSVP